MWNAQQGHDYMRLIDEKNAMVRHYKKLQQIKDKPKRPSNLNDQFIKRKQASRPASRHDKEKATKIKSDNNKLVNALEDIASTFGKLSPYVVEDGLTTKKKTLGFKYKSNLELIRENMVYDIDVSDTSKKSRL